MREIDEDERRDAIDERRARRRQGCLCGYPDWPGQCPGAAYCPVHGEDLSDGSTALSAKEKSP